MCLLLRKRLRIIFDKHAENSVNFKKLLTEESPFAIIKFDRRKKGCDISVTARSLKYEILPIMKAKPLLSKRLIKGRSGNLRTKYFVKSLVR